MKEIVIISGKGGTGKTSITASFSVLGEKELIVVDCDVDAADMHLLLQPDFEISEDFYSGQLAVINQLKCTKCGICQQICRFDAIPIIESNYIVTDLDCEGCGYCALKCPVEAISMVDQNVGKWFISKIKTGTRMVHARLGIGAENSGKLVAKVKNEARRIAIEEGKELIIIDGSPGIGCPVVSSLSGANYVVLVTEPSVSGIHDLKRVFELVKKFGIKAGCIINKADINTHKADEIKQFLEVEGVDLLAQIPFNDNFTKAMTQGQTIVEFDNSSISSALEESWEKIKTIITR
ncbi:MAG: ATP-binding protein [Candidatus Cloacimonetes bacterium]|nr:ATP-binding protein [Candidatus Cloacimonadota bacterium]